MGRQIPELTGVRAVAAASVLLYHLYFTYGLFEGPKTQGLNLLSFGWIGVDIFFVLSGFLLALPFLADPATVRTGAMWKTYLAKRWIRIAPPYYASILVALLLLHGLDYIWRYPGDIVLHILYLHTFTPETFISIVGVYWTLGIEFQFYLLLPFLALLFAHRRWPWALAGLLGFSLVWRALTWNPEGAFWSFSLLGFLGHFALGLAAARLFLDGRRLPLAAPVVFPASLLLVALPLWHFGLVDNFSQAAHDRLANVLVRPLLALAFALMLLSVTTQASVAARILRARPVQWLGETSYSLYLIHVPVLLSLKGTFVGLGFLPYVAVAVPVTLGATWLFYRIVERPALALRGRLGRAPASRPPAPAPSAPSAPADAGRPVPAE